MILNRISTAIREQDWFAVIVEFFIVIAGVVIGFQITAWNGERQERAEAADLMARLHDEILDVEMVREDWRELVQPIEMLDTLRALSPLLLDTDAADRPLTREECSALVRSHILALPPQVLPMLDELEATGAIRLIDDAAVRIALTNQLQRFERTADLVDQMTRGFHSLPALSAEAITYVAADVPENWNPMFDNSARCNLDAMRSDLAFLNQYADNTSRYYFYVETAVHATDQRLAELHAAVDAALGIDHGEAAE
ncbi:hypothetical protein [Hyphobacterium sp.]|uniref:hypothetical protein n=1 Tax=Hyphobacterium sp. TaxID=2004662 RepID=UPI003BACE406